MSSYIVDGGHFLNGFSRKGCDIFIGRRFISSHFALEWRRPEAFSHQCEYFRPEFPELVHSHAAEGVPFPNFFFPSTHTKTRRGAKE